MPKTKGEALGIVIVESGWGSVLPTVILANMSPVGAAARCGQLNIGDQIMSVNGISLVGLPLTQCQEHVKVILYPDDEYVFLSVTDTSQSVVCPLPCSLSMVA